MTIDVIDDLVVYSLESVGSDISTVVDGGVGLSTVVNILSNSSNLVEGRIKGHSENKIAGEADYNLLVNCVNGDLVGIISESDSDNETRKGKSKAIMPGYAHLTKILIWLTLILSWACSLIVLRY